MKVVRTDWGTGAHVAKGDGPTPMLRL